MLYILNDITKKNKKKLIAVNYFHPEINGSNELSIAQKICDTLNITLLAYNNNDHLPFNSLNRIPKKLNKPYIDLIHYNQIEHSSIFINKHQK